MLESQSIKIYFQKNAEEVFVIIKAKHTLQWTYVIEDLYGEKTIRSFFGKKLQKIVVLNVKNMLVHLIAELISHICYRRYH